MIANSFSSYCTWILLLLRLIGPVEIVCAYYYWGYYWFWLAPAFLLHEKGGGGASFQGLMAYFTEVQPVSDLSGNGKESSRYEKPVLMPPENIVDS